MQDDDEYSNQPDFISEKSIEYIQFPFPYIASGLSRTESFRQMHIVITRLEQLGPEHWGLLSDPTRMKKGLEVHHRIYSV